MASHFGIPGFDDTPAEELAEQEGMVDEYEELVGEDEVDRDTLDLVLERFDIEIGGSDTAMELTSEVLPPEARAAESGDPESEPSLAYEQVASELFTFLRSTRGYVGDKGNLDNTRHPIPHPLNEFLRKPEFRQQHGQSLRYWDQLESTHLSGAWVVDQFPLLNVLYGYTRADPQPGRTDLRPFPHPRDRGEVPIFVDRSPSEAIVLEVDRRAVVEWLLANDFVDGSDVPALDDDAALREWFVSNVATTQLSNPFSEIEHEVTRATYWLLHSVSHCLLGTASQQCGLATGTLSERLLPTVPAIVVYAESTENFALGSMFTLFKTRLFPWLRDAREAGESCLLDPACRDDPEGAACDACIHVTETSCVALNHKLDRRFLTGDDQAGITGFWSDAIGNNVVVPPQGHPSEDDTQ